MPTRSVLRALGLCLLACLAPLARAQNVDIHPAYHPDGPSAGYAEVYAGDPLTIELSLPYLDHPQSQGAASQYLTYLAASAGALSTPLPLGPAAQLWLDSSSLVAVLAPPSLEFHGAFQLAPGSVGLELPFQMVCIKLSDLGLHASPLLRVRALPPPASWHDEMRPVGSLAAGTTSVTFDSFANQYKLRWQGSSDYVEYVLNLNNSSFANGTLRVSENSSGLAVLHVGGIFYAQGFGVNLWSPQQFETNAAHYLTGSGIAGNSVWFEWRDEAPTLSGGLAIHNRRHEFTLVGKSLKVHVKSLDPQGGAADNYYAFRLGNVAGTQGAPVTSVVPKHVAYMDQIGITLVNNDWFHSAYVDLFQSGASSHVPALFSQIGSTSTYTELMVYARMSDGKVTALDETGWVTVSRNVQDVYVESSAPPSPYASMLAQRIGVTLSNDPQTGGKYTDDAAKIDQLRSWGFDDVYLFKFNWMRFGTNRRSTTHTPPDPQGGSEASFQSALQKGLSAGWKVAVYTDMFSLDQAQGYGDNPNYMEGPIEYENFEDGLKLEDLSYRKGFSLAVDPSQQPSTYYYSRVLAPRRTIKHWEREAGVFVGQYGTNAGYFDINCISAPDLIVTAQGSNVGGAISGDARSPSDQTLRGAIDSYKSLYRHAGDATAGPTVGEGSFVGFDSRFDTFYAGYLDGTYRTLSTGGTPTVQATSGQVQPVVPDYELKRVRGKHYGFGMGQPQRFFYSGAPGFTLPLQDVALQEYRATQISYAHNGFFLTNSGLTDGGEYLSSAQQIKEYYTFRSLQSEWAQGIVKSVAYRAAAAGSPWMDLSQAYKTGLDLVHPVIKTTWNNGLVVIVNHGLSSVVEGAYSIPTHGWTAINHNSGYFNLSVANPVGGGRVDMVIAPGYMMADGNGVLTTVGGAIGVTLHLTVVRYDTGLVLVEQHDGSIDIQ